MLVEIQEVPAPHPSDAGSWHDLATLIATGDYWETLAPSHYAQPTEPLERFASELRLQRGENPFEFLLQLNEAMYQAFEYVPNSTAVDSPIDDALRTRQGVCQDFAHIMITLLRRLHIPSRYVSGYLAHGAERRDRLRMELRTHGSRLFCLGLLGWHLTPLIISAAANVTSALRLDVIMPTCPRLAGSTRVKPKAS